MENLAEVVQSSSSPVPFQSLFPVQYKSVQLWVYNLFVYIPKGFSLWCRYLSSYITTTNFDFMKMAFIYNVLAATILLTLIGELLYHNDCTIGAFKNWQLLAGKGVHSPADTSCVVVQFCAYAKEGVCHSVAYFIPLFRPLLYSKLLLGVAQAVKVLVGHTKNELPKDLKEFHEVLLQKLKGPFLQNEIHYISCHCDTHKTYTAKLQ